MDATTWQEDWAWARPILIDVVLCTAIGVYANIDLEYWSAELWSLLGYKFGSSFGLHSQMDACAMSTYRLVANTWSDPPKTDCNLTCAALAKSHYDGLALGPDLCQVVNSLADFDWLYLEPSFLQQDVLDGVSSHQPCNCVMKLVMHRQKKFSSDTLQCEVRIVSNRLSFAGWSARPWRTDDEDCELTTPITTKQQSSLHIAMKYNINKALHPAKDFQPASPLL
ncbi:hypothetical protein BCR37DRAFT_395621 [Protomyces lactucae-debilis]|uniref:Uncharacterized protein n=1 Tax=Protomyces lactucae-debilis TaxID=2754530 RepID=A0A1Y2EU72_PROLT|nr:uncharacterized protein BCR37DRAFT_395621 [Protomyces lactucae-debilis]ORY75108.1 hypothetical protein BCR37DRAFT_395621 [Protomyces lactucae-debilis]